MAAFKPLNICIIKVTCGCFGKEQLLTIYAGPKGRSRTAATSKMKLFVIIGNGFQLLTITTKCSVLDVAAVLDPPLAAVYTVTHPPSFWEVL